MMGETYSTVQENLRIDTTAALMPSCMLDETYSMVQETCALTRLAMDPCAAAAIAVQASELLVVREKWLVW